MHALASGLALGTVVGPGWSAVGFGVVVGASGGAVRSLEAASFPHYFGTLHLGSIRGTVTAASVGSTALGPLLFASIREACGSCTPALPTTAVLPVLVAVAAVLV